MAIQAKLYLDDKEINVIACNFSYKQETDHTGRPTNKPRYMGMEMVVEVRKDVDFMELTIAPDMKKQLEIHFIPIHLTSKIRKIKLIDSHFVRNTVNYAADGITPITETLFITSAGVKDTNSETEYSATWRTTFADNTPVTVREEHVEPEMIESYYEDKQGNRIPENKVKIGDEIYLVLKTKNAIGKSIKIDLCDNIRDFEYNGSVLEDDILEGISITSEIQRIALKVVRQQKTES